MATKNPLILETETGTKNLFIYYGSWYHPKQNLMIPVSKCGQHNTVIQKYLETLQNYQNNSREWALDNGWIRFGTEAGDNACTIQGSIQTLRDCWLTMFPRIIRGKFDVIHIETVGAFSKNAFFYLPADIIDLKNLNLDHTYNYDSMITLGKKSVAYSHHAM